MRYLALLVVVLAIPMVGCAYLEYELKQAEADYMEMGRRGFLIRQGIHAHDASVSVVSAEDGHGHLDIVIRGVFDTKRQDRIIVWAKSAKVKNQIPGPIIISFQKEIPHSSQPDIILREVEI